MTDGNLKLELETLRQQIDEISKKFEADEGSHAPATDRETTSPLDEVRRVAEQLNAPELAEQAANYLNILGQDIQKSKPRALIAAFLAGFIAGRVTGR